MSAQDRFADEIAFFRENGFFRPFKVYEPEEAERLGGTIAAAVRDRSTAVYGHDNTVNYDRHLDVPELMQHIFHRAIVDRVRAVLGPDLHCWRGELLMKRPGSPGTDWHQSETFKYSTGQAHLRATEGSSRLTHLTAWTTFTSATRKNGCLKFMPGSHHTLHFDEDKPARSGRGIYDAEAGARRTGFFGYDFDDFKVDPDWQPDESEAAVLEMQPGECVLFPEFTLHGSLPNTSKYDVRFAFSARYAPTHVQIYPNLDEFVEHGSHFDLQKYGTVLVAGEDNHGHNRRRTTSIRGEPFPDPL